MENLLEKLALACRIIAKEGHSDVIWGHMSARDPQAPDRFWMKGAGVGLEEITPEDLVLVDLEGNKLAGSRPRHREFPIHSEVYRRRQEVQAVIHTHPFYATIMASMEEPLRVVTHEGSLFVPPPIPRFDLTTNLIMTKEQGQAVAQALGQHRALLMKNHGVVVAAESIEEACVSAILLEKACKAHLTAAAAGKFSSPSDQESLEKRATIYRPEAFLSAWEYYCRRLGSG